MLPPSASLSSDSCAVQGKPKPKARWRCFASRGCCSRQRSGVEHVTAPDPNPFVDCGVIIFQGGATRFDRQLASTIHCVDDEIIKCLKRRERGAAGDLGDDVQLTVERGARNFASGDRIMF